MDWTLEQLNSFVAAAEKGSFSEAARSLGRAQSVVSTHVATLEAELGVDLFDLGAPSGAHRSGTRTGGRSSGGAAPLQPV